MEALLVDRPEQDGADLYLFVRLENGNRMPFRINDTRVEAQMAVYEGQELPVTLRLDRLVLAALRAALIGEALQRDDSLADARRTRDRLLVMVESEWESRQIERSP